MAKKQTGFSVGDRANSPFDRALVIIDLLQGSSEENPVGQEQIIQILNRKSLLGMKSLESKKRTLRRDIDGLKDDRGAPIRTVTRNRKTFYYLSAPFSFSFDTSNNEPKREVKVSEMVVQTIKAAQRKQCCIRMTYRKPGLADDEPLAVRLVEPHVLTDAGGAQYVAGYQRREVDGRLLRERRTFALHRIVRIGATLKPFDYDKDLLTEADHGDIFNFTKIEGAQVRVDKSVKTKFIERAEARRYSIENLPGGAVRVSLPPLPELNILALVLSYGGKVTLEKPKSLRAKVHAAAEQILKAH